MENSAGEPLLLLELDGPDPVLLGRLRPSERAVVEGVLAGKSQAEIARARGTSRRTVANQMARILEVFGVGSRLELARVLARRSPAPDRQPMIAA
ncbi:MAG: LuxR C-terminal-related transcriptional regulator [Myxococcales bacterium]